MGTPLRDARAGLVELVVLTLFSWWTIDLLLAGHVTWRRLLPAAVATSIF